MEIIDTNYINDRDIIVKRLELSEANTIYYYVEIYANDYDKNIIDNIGLSDYLENIQEQILENNELLDYADIFFKGKDYSVHFSCEEDLYDFENRMMYLMSFEDI